MTQQPTLDAPQRRDLFRLTAALAGAAVLPAGSAAAQAAGPAPAPVAPAATPAFTERMLGFVLSHEQFPAPELVKLAARAAGAGFPLLATSDHFQPWMSGEGHSGQAWVTLGAAGSQAGNAWMGTHVTCPTLRYTPAVVAEGFATLDRLYPGRIFLGLGSGEALNEQAATGTWPKWQERWDRLIEAITIIRGLWSGQPVDFTGKHYRVKAKLYDPPVTPIPLLTAANGPKAMALAGQYGDGLITDPDTWKQHKPIWEKAARAAGKDPGKMPVMMEAFVVVGDTQEARRAAEYWRFLPKAWHSYFDIESPDTIQKKADAEVSIDKMLATWTVGEDAATHIAGMQKLFDSGVTIINVHSGQPDQNRVIDFYAKEVLPHFRS